MKGLTCDTLSRNIMDYKRVLSNVEGLITSAEQVRESIEQLGSSDIRQAQTVPQAALCGAVMMLGHSILSAEEKIKTLELSAKSAIKFAKEAENERTSCPLKHEEIDGLVDRVRDI